MSGFRLTPEMTTALRGGRHPIAPLIKAELPGHTLTHLVGSAEVMFGGEKYVGRDDRFGALISAGNLKDGVGDEAPDWPLTWAPPSTAAVADLTEAEAQGSRIRGWLAVINPATGLVLPDPILCFIGTLDFGRLRIGKGSRTVEWRCISALEAFHDDEIGARLSDAWHKLVWPGETGLANMTGIERTSYWGVENPPSTVSVGNSALSKFPSSGDVYV